MGRTRLDRAEPMQAWPAKLEVGAQVLSPFATKQMRGDAYYGEFVYPAEKRARRAYMNSALLFAQQEIDWQPLQAGVADPREFVPPPVEEPPELELGPLALPALPAPVNPISAPMYTPPTPVLEPPPATLPMRKPSPVPQPQPPPANPRDNEALIEEQRGAGKSWPEIARMLPGTNADMLRKHYNNKMRARVQAEKEAALKAAKKAARNQHDGAAQSGSPNGEEENVAAVSAPAAAAQTAKPGSAGGTGAKPGSGSKGKAAAAQPAGESPRAGDNDAECVELDARCTDRSGGDTRVKMLDPLPQPPADHTVLQAHALTSLDGVDFYGGVEVVDPDDEHNIFVFKLEDKTHCACFNIGVGPEDSPLISWSDLHCLYCLPDGSKWAEHGNFNDLEDLEDFAKKKEANMKALLAREAAPQELFKKRGRFHSRLQNIEYECWITHGELPDLASVPGTETDIYFWTSVFDPVKMTVTPVDSPGPKA